MLVLSGEDDIADTIRPRLDAADADPSHVLTIIQDLDPETEELRPRSFSLKRDVVQLDEAVAERPECRLVIIDPISAYLDGTDSHNNSDVRGVLAPLAELAARREVAVVAVSHLNKGGHGSAMYRTTGSLAFVAAARAVYLVGKDKDNPDRRLVLPVKNNLAADNTGIAYSMGVGDNDAPNVMWESDPVTVTADEALASTPAEYEESRPKLSTAKEWLKEMLKDGPMLVEDNRKEARAAGVAWRTLEEAKADLGVKSEKGEFSGKWSWVRQDRKDPPAKARAPRSSAEANNDAGSSEDRNRGLGAGTSPRASGGGADDPNCEVF